MPAVSPLRQTVNEILDQLPVDATIEDLQYHLLLRQRIEKSIRQADNGELIDHDDVEKRIEQWLTESDGRLSRSKT